jgi:hypothetical protein
MILTLNKYYSGDPIKENEMDRAYGTCRVLVEKLIGKRSLG